MTTHVLLLEGSRVIPQVCVAIDSTGISKDAVSGYRTGVADPVVVIPSKGVEYAIFGRDLFATITREAAIRSTNAQLDALKELRKELDPTGVAEEEMVHALDRAQIESAHASLKPVERKAEGRGMYL